MKKLIFCFFVLYLSFILVGCNKDNIKEEDVPDTDLENYDFNDEISQDIDTMTEEDQVVGDNELDSLDKDLNELENIELEDTEMNFEI